MDVDQDLVRRRLGFGGVGQVQGLDALEGIAKNGAHFTLRGLIEM